jgi:hypothetical protein
MILAGLITRQEAIDELALPLYNEKELEEDLVYFRKKLGLTSEAMSDLLKAPLRSATEFSNDAGFYQIIKTTQRYLERITGVRIRGYS